MRGADLLAQTLANLGVDRIFSLSGNQIMPVYDACIDAGIKLVHVRQEAAAVHMADAWGRLTGQPGVALVTAGPGFANSLTGLYVARVSESPVVLLSGHAPLPQLGRGAFQEMEQAEMASHVSKASWTAKNALSLGDDVANAFDIALSGRPGPVHIALPADAINGEVDDLEGALLQVRRRPPSAVELADGDLQKVVHLLSSADRPLILAGSMMLRGDPADAIRNFGITTGIPVVCMESPRGINDPALGAFAEVLASADLILLMGKKLDFTLQLGEAIDPDASIVQIDPDEDVLKSTVRNVGDSARLTTFKADPLSVVGPLTDVATEIEVSETEWLDEVSSAVSYQPDSWLNMRAIPGEPLCSYEVTQAVQEYLNGADESIFISDGGEFGQWAQACITSSTRIINGPAGSIGTAIPFAMAARLARPNARIVTMLGDGTFGFHAMELDTAVRYGLDFVAVVGNDSAWNAEYQIQLREYGEDRTIETELLSSRYDQVAVALGAHGEYVTNADDLPQALDRAGSSGLPACINVVINRDAAPVVRRGVESSGTSATLH